MKANVFRVHPEKVETWRLWAAELHDRKEEVEETLREEGLAWEGCLLFEYGGHTFTVLAAHPTEGVEQKPATPRELNEKHRRMMRECFAERIGAAEAAYYFQR